MRASREGAQSAFDAIIAEIGECAACTPERLRPAFGTLLRSIANALVGQPDAPTPDMLEIHPHIREELPRRMRQLAAVFPHAAAHLARLLEKAAESAVDGSMPMGTGLPATQTVSSAVRKANSDATE